MDVIRHSLKVMDSTAITLCMDNNLPIIVFNIRKEDNLKKILLGKRIGSIVLREVKDDAGVQEES
jgi:uridylate kinase